MESFIAAANSDMQADVHIPELDLRAFDKQASYVIRRDQTSTICPVPVLNPRTTRTAKMTVTDANFIDVGSCFFTFTVRNLANAADNQVLQPLSAIPHNFFRRMRVMLNGTVLEDISHLNRVEEQISRFLSAGKRRNAGDAGTGWATLTDEGTGSISKTIPRNGTKKVSWRPLSSGFMACGKYVPLLGGSAGGWSVELELADPADAVLAHGDEAAGGLSQSWAIEDLRLHVDSVTLTTDLANEFAEQLVNDSILIPFQSIACDMQYFAPGTTDVNISLAKQYSRLNTVTASFCDLPEAVPPAGAAGVHSRTMNRFYLAHANKDKVNTYLQVNNQRFPAHDTVGATQHFVRLQQGLGLHNSLMHSLCFSQDAYGGTDAGDAAPKDARYFLVMNDVEAVPHVSASGMPVLGGGVIQFVAKDVGQPRTVYLTCQFDSVCEIRNQGCALFT